MTQVLEICQQIDCSTEQDQLIQLAGKLKRVFASEDFEDPSNRRKICGPIPSLIAYRKKQAIIRSQVNEQEIAGFIRPCYDQPLLDFAQEQHLFRRYNYHKFCARQHVEKSNLSAAEKEFSKAVEVRKLITSANIRLVMPTITKYHGYGHQQDLFSEAMLAVHRAVDYFDWRRGLKFSTYATWGVQRSISKAYAINAKQDLHFSICDNDVDENRLATESEYAVETQHARFVAVVDRLLQFINDRERGIVLGRFMGGRTLQEIADDMRISKERVRQIERRALEKMVEGAEALKIKFEAI